MVYKNELQKTSMNENEISRQGLNSLEFQDDTIIYVMHGALNHLRVLYKNNRNIMNNLD